MNERIGRSRQYERIIHGSEVAISYIMCYHLKHEVIKNVNGEV